MLCGLAAGLSMDDIRGMKYTHLVQFVWEYEDMNGAEREETEDAKPSDVRALMAL